MLAGCGGEEAAAPAGTTVAEEQLVAGGALRACVGSAAPAPYVTGKGEGFDVGLLRAVADRLALSFETVSVDDPAAGVVHGVCDAGVGKLRVTLAAQRDVSLLPYLEVGHALLVRAGSTVDPRRPCGVRIAVVRGAGREATADALAARCELEAIVVGSGERGAALLRAGSVDAVLDDTPANRRRARGGLRLASPDVGHVRYGIAIPEGRDSLYFGIRGALALVQEDGRFRRLQDRWGLREAHMITLS